MLEIGGKYYFLVHAYYHYLAEVVAIHGVRRCSVKNLVQVHSCGRGWSAFFKDGCKNDTKLDHIGSSPDFSYQIAFDWPHAIPERK